MNGLTAILLGLIFLPVLALAAVSPSTSIDQRLQSFRILSPREGDTLIVGRTYHIIWVGSFPADTDVYANMRGGSSGDVFVPIGQVFSSPHSISFTVPNLPGTNYVIAFSGKAWFEQSGSFSIVR